MGTECHTERQIGTKHRIRECLAGVGEHLPTILPRICHAAPKSCQNATKRLTEVLPFTVLVEPVGIRTPTPRESDKSWVASNYNFSVRTRRSV
jgi:hypothetical protein